MDEARAAAARVSQLQPTFRYSKQFSGVNCAPALAASLGEALSETGLPSAAARGWATPSDKTIRQINPTDASIGLTAETK